MVAAAAVGVTMSNHVSSVGDTDTVYLQFDGGPIGLELAGAVSRPFMMRWDRLYLEAVEADQHSQQCDWGHQDGV